jgi:hypothetical protein
MLKCHNSPEDTMENCEKLCHNYYTSLDKAREVNIYNKI